MAVDSLGNVHYATQIRYPKSLWLTHWDGRSWSPKEEVYRISLFDKDPAEEEHIHVHNTRMVFRKGNQLVITFTNSPGDEYLALYATHKTLKGVPALDTKPLPTPTPTPSVSTPTPEPTSTPILLPTPTITPIPFDINQTQILEDIPSPARSFWVALIPTILLTCGVFAFQLIRRL